MPAGHDADINGRIETIVRATLPELATDVDQHGPQTELLSTGLLSSRRLLALLSSLEEQFDIVVPDTEFVGENFGTIADLTRLVQRNSP